MAKNQNRNAGLTDPTKTPVELTDEQKQALEQQQAGDGSEANQQLDPSAGSESGDQNLEQGTESAATGTALLIGGFEISARLSELLGEDGNISVKVLGDKAVQAIEAGEAPLHMHDLPQRLPQAALARYYEEVKRQELDPELVTFVIADPKTDPTLKSINFMRAISGLTPTFFYPRFSAPIEE